MPSILSAAFSTLRESLETVFPTAFASLDATLPIFRASLPIVASVFREIDLTVVIAFFVPIPFVSIFGLCALATTGRRVSNDIEPVMVRKFVNIMVIFFSLFFYAYLLTKLTVFAFLKVSASQKIETFPLEEDFFVGKLRWCIMRHGCFATASSYRT